MNSLEITTFIIGFLIGVANNIFSIPEELSSVKKNFKNTLTCPVDNTNIFEFIRYHLVTITLDSFSWFRQIKQVLNFFLVASSIVFIIYFVTTNFDGVPKFDESAIFLVSFLFASINAIIFFFFLYVYILSQIVRKQVI